MVEGGLRSAEFGEKLIFEELGLSTASRYVHDYLCELNTSSVLIEEHYVDRHFLDDYASYYARSFAPPRHHCKRLHFFKEVSTQELGKALTRAASPTDRLEVEGHLAEQYLGFVVERPLPRARVGRTVLRTYPVDDNRRHYSVVRPYTVYIGGLVRITIHGLAFQQQDVGAAVCASTSLWSALQRVAYLAGNRTPTPSGITSAAGSPYPANHGLSELNMAAALSSLGYVAEVFQPSENRAWFRAKLTCCLESQLPAVLLLTTKRATGAGKVEVGHAVTVTGFSEPVGAAAVATTDPGLAPICLRGSELAIIYVHDDNLGSHAHYELFDSDELDDNSHRKLMLRRGRKDHKKEWWTVDEWTVIGALVPKPEKLRLPLESLLGHLIALRPVLDATFNNAPLELSARFSTGTEYKRTLQTDELDGKLVQDFMLNQSLPRHLGVLSASCNGALLLNVLVDVTEVERQTGVSYPLAMIAPGVPTRSMAAANLRRLAGGLQERAGGGKRPPLRIVTAGS
jgi:hypothetical protein